MPDPSEIRPLLSGSVPTAVADLAGGIAYSGVTENEELRIAFGGPTADFILYGVVNGSFSQGPADPNANIEAAANPLPYWYGPVQVSGGAVTASWAADTDSPSGYNLRLTLNPGAASDEAYFQQIVPVSASRARATGHVVRALHVGVSATGAGADVYIGLRYLDVTGAEVGSATETTTSVSGGTQAWVTAYGNAQSGGSPPGDAYYLRIRLGIRRDTAAATDAVVADFTDVRADNAHAFYPIAEGYTLGSSKSAGILKQASGVVYLGPNGGSSTTESKLVLGGGVTTLAAISSGTTTPDALTLSGSTVTVSGTLAASGAVGFTGTIAPTISGNQDDWAPTDGSTATIWVVNPSGASRTVTGISISQTDGRVLFIANSASSNNLVLANETTSTAANQIVCPGGANLTIRPGGGVTLVYAAGSGGNSRWRVLSP